MKFLEKNFLANRGPVSPEEPDLIKNFLIGEEPILEFENNHNEYGCDHCSFFPAVYDGEKKWLLREVWTPAPGYCASGTSEFVLEFEEGLKIFLENQVFDFPIEEEK